MSDVHGAAPAAGHSDQASEAPDDGFTAEERAQFAEMQRDTEAPPADAPIDPPADAPAAGAAPADGDDDGDDDPAAGAAGAPGAAADDGSRKPRRVSFSKYDRETKELRDALAKANATVAEKNETMARFDERMKIINEALATPPAADPAAAAAAKAPVLPSREDDPEPDKEENIFEHNAWLSREIQRERAERLQEREDRQQQDQSQTTERETTSAYMQDAERFAGAEPNFGPAYQFLMASRVAELAVHYFDKDVSAEKLTPQEYAKITQTIVKEEKQIVATAIKAGKSPAKQLFTIAKSRGFKPGAPAAAAPAPAANGKGAPAPLAAPASAASVVEDIRRVASGQDAALSLSGGGGAPAAVMDATRLANMPQAEFERWMDETPPDQIRKLMGG